MNVKKLFSILTKEDESVRRLPRNFMDALALNGFAVDRQNDPDRALPTHPDTPTKGGFIVFPAGIGGNSLADNEIQRYANDRLETMASQAPNAATTSATPGRQTSGWEVAVGRFVQGTYQAPDQPSPARIRYTAESLSLDIMNVSPDQLVSLAKDLATRFSLDGVLLKTYPGTSFALIRP